MLKTYLTAAAVAAALATPAFAQNPPSSSAPPTPPSQSQDKPAADKPAASSQQEPGFMQSQSAEEWRSSKLVGTSVYGPDEKSIGKIDDLIIDNDGSIKAVVVGVGGFLGVGQKDVAMPFKSIKVTRKQNSSSIDKVTVNYTKDQLNGAPNFAYYQAPSTSTTGASPAGSPPRGGMHPPAGMGK